MGKRESKNQGYVELCSSEWLYTGACSGKVSEFLTIWVTIPQTKSRDGGIYIIEAWPATSSNLDFS